MIKDVKDEEHFQEAKETDMVFNKSPNSFKLFQKKPILNYKI